MNPIRRAIATALSLALLAGCESEPRHQPPVAKTNPDPKERYEITVRLIDPPSDIQGISGVANFGIRNVICMHSPDPIAGYTPGSHYEHPFALEPIGKNTYRGYLYLDWPIDEDYYGLGICHWELASFKIIMPRESYTQTASIWRDELHKTDATEILCRHKRRMGPDELCSLASEQNIERMGSSSFKLVIHSKENGQ